MTFQRLRKVQFNASTSLQSLCIGIPIEPVSVPVRTLTLTDFALYQHFVATGLGIVTSMLSF